MMKKLIAIGAFCAILLVNLSGCSTSGGTVDGEKGEVRVNETGDPLAETNVRLGLGYMQKGNYDIALRKIRKALEIDSNNVNGHYAIALLYERLDRPKLAEEHYRRTIELNPQYSEAQNAYGVFLCRHERYDEANPHFEKALQNPLYRTPQIVYVNGGICASKNGKYELAEDYLRKGLQRNPKNVTALLEMAKVTFATKQYLRTRAYLQRYSAVAPHTAETLWLGIRLEKILGDKDAVASYSTLLRNKFPDSKETSLLSQMQHNG